MRTIEADRLSRAGEGGKQGKNVAAAVADPDAVEAGLLDRPGDLDLIGDWLASAEHDSDFRCAHCAPLEGNALHRVFESRWNEETLWRCHTPPLLERKKEIGDTPNPGKGAAAPCATPVDSDISLADQRSW